MCVKKRSLYLGLDPSTWQKEEKNFLHYPVIRTESLAFSEEELAKMEKDFLSATHLLFTSRVAVKEFEKLRTKKNEKAQVIAVGKATAEELEAASYQLSLVAKEESSEGLVKELKLLELSEATFFWPHSARSRSVLSDFFQERGVILYDWLLYDTCAFEPEEKVNLEAFDEIFFTSPSTVDAFAKIYPQIPKEIELAAIGPVTEKRLKELFLRKEA